MDSAAADRKAHAMPRLDRALAPLRFLDSEYLDRPQGWGICAVCGEDCANEADYNAETGISRHRRCEPVQADADMAIRHANLVYAAIHQAVMGTAGPMPAKNSVTRK